MNPLHRHTELLSVGGTWGSASEASFLQAVPLCPQEFEKLLVYGVM